MLLPSRIDAAVANNCDSTKSSSSLISTSSDRLNVLIPELPAEEDKEEEEEEDKSEEDFVLFSTSLILDTSSWRGSTVRSSTWSNVVSFRFPFSSIFSSCSYLDLPPVLFVVRIHVILLFFFTAELRILSTVSATRWDVKLFVESRLTALLAFPWYSISIGLVLVSTTLATISTGVEIVLDCLSNITAVFVDGWRPMALATRKLCLGSLLSVSIEVILDVDSEFRRSCCTWPRGSTVLDGIGFPKITENQSVR